MSSEGWGIAVACYFGGVIFLTVILDCCVVKQKSLLKDFEERPLEEVYAFKRKLLDGEAYYGTGSWFSDYKFYMMNNHQFFSMFLADPLHPLTTNKRRTIYWVTQTFTLFCVVLLESNKNLNSTQVKYISFLVVAPINLLVNAFLFHCLACPCLLKPHNSTAENVKVLASVGGQVVVVPLLILGAVFIAIVVLVAHNNKDDFDVATAVEAYFISVGTSWGEFFLFEAVAFDPVRKFSVTFTCCFVNVYQIGWGAWQWEKESYDLEQGIEEEGKMVVDDEEDVIKRVLCCALTILAWRPHMIVEDDPEYVKKKEKEASGKKDLADVAKEKAVEVSEEAYSKAAASASAATDVVAMKMKAADDLAAKEMAAVKGKATGAKQAIEEKASAQLATVKGKLNTLKSRSRSPSPLRESPSREKEKSVVTEQPRESSPGPA